LSQAYLEVQGKIKNKKKIAINENLNLTNKVIPDFRRAKWNWRSYFKRLLEGGRNSMIIAECPDEQAENRNCWKNTRGLQNPKLLSLRARFRNGQKKDNHSL